MSTPRTIIDPTKNVDALVAADARRQDEIRVLEISHVKELIKISDDHIKEMIAQGSSYEAKLRIAEEKRIDANLQGEIQMQKELSNRLQQVERNQHWGTGSSRGMRDMWGWVAFAIMAIIALIGAAVAIISYLSPHLQ